jgi:hypothetical protein
MFRLLALLKRVATMASGMLWPLMREILSGEEIRGWRQHFRVPERAASSQPVGVGGA